ncbi:hypothetical protein U1Q18_039310, partial [Sarracenia purpurea var. burkii]
EDPGTDGRINGSAANLVVDRDETIDELRIVDGENSVGGNAVDHRWHSQDARRACWRRRLRQDACRRRAVVLCGVVASQKQSVMHVGGCAQATTGSANRKSQISGFRGGECGQ